MHKLHLYFIYISVYVGYFQVCAVNVNRVVVRAAVIPVFNYNFTAAARKMHKIGSAGCGSAGSGADVKSIKVYTVRILGYKAYPAHKVHGSIQKRCAFAAVNYYSALVPYRVAHLKNISEARAV